MELGITGTLFVRDKIPQERVGVVVYLNLGNLQLAVVKCNVQEALGSLFYFEVYSNFIAYCSTGNPLRVVFKNLVLLR